MGFKVTIEAKESINLGLETVSSVRLKMDMRVSLAERPRRLPPLISRGLSIFLQSKLNPKL